MEPVFVGGHPAIDFVNTAFSPQGEPVDVIHDGRSFLDWLVRAGLLTESASTRLRRRVSAKRLDAAATAARDMRTWARSWITRWRLDPEADYGAELRRLNTYLHRGASSREVIAENGCLRLAERVRLESVDDVLAIVATRVAALVTGENPSCIKSCAGSNCTLLFLDRTKGRRRLFCSASTCGNRAKVAAFRARQAGP